MTLDGQKVAGKCLRRGLISKSWLDFSDYLESNRRQVLACNDIIQCNDSNGDVLTAEGGSGWPESSSEVDDLLPFLLFAALSPMFVLIFPRTLCLSWSNTCIYLLYAMR